MELVNHTPLPADLRVSGQVNTPNRRGFLHAKATFRFTKNRAELERDAPVPLFVAPTTRGAYLLPEDVSSHDREPFEVMLVGHAVSATGPVRHLRVRMALGHEVRELDVYGDRVWQGDQPSDPVPFTDMPLSWDRALGGTVDMEIDHGAKVRVSDPINPAGRGFDPQWWADALARELSPPPGFPRWPQALRPLPNLEDPQAPIRRPDDRPTPWCWAPVPVEAAAKVKHLLEQVPPGAEEMPEPIEREMVHASLRQAHPCWWIPRPARGARLKLEGVLPEGKVDVSLPALRVVADYVAADRRGVIELTPQCLLVLPDEHLFTVNYRADFLIQYREGDERGLRLRVEEGWYD